MRTMTKSTAKENTWASAWAGILNDEYHHWHRGAFHCGGAYRVIFGNDGYGQDERAKDEVRIVRDRLNALGIAVEGFATGFATQ